MKLQTLSDRFIVAVALIIIWKTAAISVGSLWLASPEAVLHRLFEQIANGEIVRHSEYTIRAALIGFAIGGIPGTLLPFLLRRAPNLTAVLEPYLVAGYALPKLALVPLFVIWFGIGIGSKIALVAAVSFFLLFFHAISGVRAIDPRIVDALRVMGATERQIAWHVIWPSAVPYIFAGFRVSLPYAIGGAAVAELISSNRGLGFLIQSGAMDFDSATSLAAVIALTLLAFAAGAIVSAFERFLLKWRPALSESAIVGAGT